MQSVDFMLFAEYFQFHVQDGETDDTVPVHWEPENEEDMILVTEQVLAVRTVRELDVPVTVEIVDKKPQDDEPLEDWDHVVACSLKIPSGKLLLTATTESVYESLCLDVEAGTYGVRVYYGGLDEVDSEGFEGDDNYKIKLWIPEKDDEPPAFEVLKQWIPVKTF